VKRARAPRGFTLIEVLVALVIVAVGMAAVLSALSSSANTLSFLRDETFAQWVALNKIATIRISGQQPATGTSDGDTDFAGRSWHWRQEVVTTEVPVGVADGYNPSWGAQTPRYAATQGATAPNGIGVGTSGTNIQMAPSSTDSGLGGTPDSGLGSSTPTPDTLLSPTPQSPQQ
jgi:type II secretion system protein I